MTTFRSVLDAGMAYNARFSHVPNRTVSNDILGIFGVDTKSAMDLLPEDYDRFIEICNLYVNDPDDDMVVLTN